MRHLTSVAVAGSLVLGLTVGANADWSDTLKTRPVPPLPRAP